MADIRIKDLATLESASLTGDVFVIDGTTGTRKLSAFSPTFGGNATVGGTLTVTGNTTLSGNLDVASGISTGTAQLQIGNGRTGSGYAYVDLVGDTTYSDYGFRIIRNNGGANTSSELAHRGTGDFALVANDAAPIKFYTNGVTAATIAATTGNTTIHSTTASLGTSSGALVVGGGVGIGGSLNAGANSAANSITGGDAGSGTSILQLKDGLGSVKVNFKGNGDVAVQSSTASTTTSSGALVVSGGVGVAGAIYAGGSLNVASSSTALTSLNSSTSGATGYNQASFTLDSGGTPKTAVLGVQDTGAFVGTNTNHDVTIRTNTTTRVTVSSSDVTIASGVGLKLGNAYAAGAPTATGYIVIKDSTGTSYKIPAVAL